MALFVSYQCENPPDGGMGPSIPSGFESQLIVRSSWIKYPD